ncbi:MAG TPA: class I SAM-dependent RNA methyltransferase [Ktedonobacterales bacterium]|nr:class I SAM-dependent RNA methyltransferase [Ktedonobacterales bacterium]
MQTEILLHTPPPERRDVTGRYSVRVDRLSETGEAHGVVAATLDAPSDEDFTLVFGERHREAWPPTEFTFIGGLPGELIEVDATWRLPHPNRKRARHVPAPTVRVRHVLEAAPARVLAPCPVFGECGGCQLQHLDYAAQLSWKTQRMRDLLAIVGFESPPVAPAIGCEPPWQYRNHMRFSVNREGRAGLTARNSHRVLPLRACPIAHPRINEALAILEDEMLPQPQILIRYGEASGQILMQPAASPELRTRLAAAGLDIHETDMEESLLGQPFTIRPSSFFQTNTRQANRMAELVLDRLPAGSDVTLVDAYCGVGTFARLLAPQAGRVLAIEESASAIRDARVNLNNVPNVTILQGKVEDILPRIPDTIHGLVIDPPRAGCQRTVLDSLVARRVPRLVYISCGPDTLARDLAYLCLRTAAYRLISVQPLDMFPQTAHIENVTLLEAI